MKFLPLLIILVGVVLFLIAYFRDERSTAFYILAFALWIIGVVMGVVKRH